MTVNRMGLPQWDKPRLMLGIVILSARAFGSLTKDEIYKALGKHQAGDWGILRRKDWDENDEALNNQERVKSVYQGSERKFWVITEGNRSFTRVQLPHEY